MPAPTIYVTAPSSGQGCSMSFPASGGYAPSPAGGTLALYYQINGGPGKAITSFGSGTWNLTLTTTDCPNIGQYMLTVYISESGNPMIGNAFRQFSRSS